MITAIGWLYLIFVAKLTLKCDGPEEFFQGPGFLILLYFVILVPLGAPIW